MNTDRLTTYKLQYPVEYGDQVITELKIRRPRGKQLKNLPTETAENLVPNHEMAAELCGQPPQMLDMLEKEDWWAVIGTVQDFLSPTKPTSDGPSPSSPGNPST